MTIGIYGGSFDPIHSGHAIVANFISQCNIVDEVWLMVAKKNPLKPHSTFASEKHRLEMAKLVAKDGFKIKASDLELSLSYPSYTYDTLVELKRINPDHQFKLIIGSDSLNNFNNWRNCEKILKEFGVIVYPRPGSPLKGEEPEGMTFLTGAPEVSLSSSLIREYIASGWNINYFVPIAVSQYITENKLYL